APRRRVPATPGAAGRYGTGRPSPRGTRPSAPRLPAHQRPGTPPPTPVITVTRPLTAPAGATPPDRRGLRPASGSARVTAARGTPGGQALHQGRYLGLQRGRGREAVVDGGVRGGRGGAEPHPGRERLEVRQLGGVPLRPAAGQAAAEGGRVRPDPDQAHRGPAEL